MKALQIIIGIILLLPGICSLVVVFVSGGAGTDGLKMIWVICFMIAAFGSWLIYLAGRQ